MLDRQFIGHEFESFSVDVEKGRLKFFAKAIGETNPIYTDESAARDAGYRTIPAPPTFPMVLDMEGSDLLPVIRVLKLDLARILHGAQEFEYQGEIYAGDKITVHSKILNIFDKKGGALEFVQVQNSYINQDDEPVVKAVSTLVYRNS